MRSSTFRPGTTASRIGDEPCVQIEWSGIRAWAGFPTGVHSRVLVTLLFTDVVDSTSLVSRLGDTRWRELLSELFEACRRELERFGGREVNTTGDGMVATFDGPARALHCAAALRRSARTRELELRSGVHVGEVELVGTNVRGIAVHEAARVMAAAAPGEIVVSELTRALASASGLRFDDRGVHALKGLEGEWRLAAFLADGGLAVSGDDLPLILAVDEDAEALERITGELQRYARDYRVICGPSTQAALDAARSPPAPGRRGRDRARRPWHRGAEGGGPPRARARPAPAREARAADPVGRVGRRGDGGRDPHARWPSATSTTTR